MQILFSIFIEYSDEIFYFSQRFFLDKFLDKFWAVKKLKKVIQNVEFKDKL